MFVQKYEAIQAGIRVSKRRKMAASAEEQAVSDHEGASDKSCD
jgi:hypothetical protein